MGKSGIRIWHDPGVAAENAVDTKGLYKRSQTWLAIVNAMTEISFLWTCYQSTSRQAIDWNIFTAIKNLGDENNLSNHQIIYFSLKDLNMQTLCVMGLTVHNWRKQRVLTFGCVTWLLEVNLILVVAVIKSFASYASILPKILHATACSTYLPHFPIRYRVMYTINRLHSIPW